MGSRLPATMENCNAVMHVMIVLKDKMDEINCKHGAVVSKVRLLNHTYSKLTLRDTKKTKDKKLKKTKKIKDQKRDKKSKIHKKQ